MTTNERIVADINADKIFILDKVKILPKNFHSKKQRKFSNAIYRQITILYDIWVRIYNYINIYYKI